MRCCRTLLALVVLASAAGGAEIFPLKGEAAKGDIVSISDKEVVFKGADGKDVTKPIHEVLKIEFRDVTRPAAGTKYSQIELTDGTILLASKWLIKKSDVELTLLAGPSVKVALELVANVLRVAEDETHRRDWKLRVANTRNREALVLKNEEEKIISSIEGSLGKGNEAGTSISFAVTIDGETTTASRDLATIHGLIFKHTLPAKAPPVACKLIDTLEDVVMVASLSSTGKGVTVTTPAGAKIDFTREQIARVDYTKGRFEYLSEMPYTVVARCNLDEDVDKGDYKPSQWHVYPDTCIGGETNRKRRPLTLGGVVYHKGLAVKPYVELTWELKGAFRELSVVIGIDDNVKAAGGTIVTFERDGKELATEKISSDDKTPRKSLTLNVKDVQKLKIIVKSDGDLDTSRHLDLADAKVSK